MTGAACRRGLVYLVLPGFAAPPLGGSLLMLSASIAWGVYSPRGRAAADPLATTAGNFLLAAPLGIALAATALPSLRSTRRGGVYAALSGALASGAGYAVWYTALRGLRATQAATVKLSVPVLRRAVA